MTRRHSIAEARSNLPKLVRDAETGKTVELTRRGEPVAVLIGRKDYERLTSKLRSFSEAYASFARDVGLRELAIDPEEVFSSVRDEASGRDVSL